MLTTIPPNSIGNDPSVTAPPSRAPHKHRSFVSSPLKENEIVLLKDGTKAKSWYCAEVVKVLPTHIKVNYYTTTTPPLAKHLNSSVKDRKSRLEQAIFLKTWCLNKGKGPATTEVPKGAAKRRNVWSGEIQIGHLKDHLLIRDVKLSALGKLDSKTVALASTLDIHHHQGA